MDAVDELERGREAYRRWAWTDAYARLGHADRAAPLSADDLELLARAAYMLGRDDEYVAGLEHAHDLHLDAGDPARAARCAFWIGHNMLFRGDVARATGWFARGQRSVEQAGQDCVERGYLLIPVWLGQMAGGDWETGYATAAAAAEIGERFGDADLVWLARDEQGRARLKQGRVGDGLALVDEVLVIALAGELSPIVTGIVYCNTIAFCASVYELRHARAWTEALKRWCDRQPEMVAHNGLCLVHRAEMMQLQGAWTIALEDARRAAAHFTEGVLNQLACGQAHYRQGEVHRLQGEFAAAERAYREASRCGCEPQPGLVRLRLAQGSTEAAVATIRRVVAETAQPLRRAELLAAYIEVMLAVGELEEARSACRELAQIASRHQNEVLRAMAAQARGALALVDAEGLAALPALREALAVWQELGAPYEVARVRTQIGLACRSLGDEESASLELDAARSVFAALGAATDLRRVQSLSAPTATFDRHGLSDRELEVLRLVAAGARNKQIAAELVLSERTVERHLANIFTKLRVSSRAAATAYAYEHELV